MKGTGRNMGTVEEGRIVAAEKAISRDEGGN